MQLMPGVPLSPMEAPVPAIDLDLGTHTMYGVQRAEEDLQGYEVPEKDAAAVMERLDAFACARVEVSAREAANTALPRMKDRFSEVSHRPCLKFPPSSQNRHSYVCPWVCS
jgi:hypothetical protein